MDCQTFAFTTLTPNPNGGWGGVEGIEIVCSCICTCVRLTQKLSDLSHILSQDGVHP